MIIIRTERTIIDPSKPNEKEWWDLCTEEMLDEGYELEQLCTNCWVAKKETYDVLEIKEIMDEKD